ncbi:MAG: riboflavin biosynthesis protein RibF [Tepidisphaerales bacterium]
MKAPVDQLRTLPPGSVVTIGNFDGVHLGHRALLAHARDEARRRGTVAVAVTFDPHPMAVLRPESAPLRLTPLDLKVELLQSAGADEVVVLPPSQDILSLEAEDFFALLSRDARVAHLVEGESFCFGRNRRGTVDVLRAWTRDAGMGLTVLPSVEVGLLDRIRVPVSSSLIRTLAGYGRVRDAGICLGGPLFLVGRVVEGQRRGRQLGFPTANLDCTGNVVPGDGVYAARVRLAGETFAAAVHVGPVPTFGVGQRQVEVHLLGFSGDLYGQTLRVEVIDYLRDLRKFASLDALKARLSVDCAQAARLAELPDLLAPTWGPM